MVHIKLIPKPVDEPALVQSDCTDPGVEKRPADRLAEAVWFISNVHPFVSEGRAWANRPLDWWGDLVGTSTKTIQRCVRKPPFLFATKQYEGKNRLLLRLGEADDITFEGMARQMRKDFDKSFPRENVPPVRRKKEFGCLVGLAKLWTEARPDLFAPAIFRSVIFGWPTYVALIHVDIDLDKEEATLKGEDSGLYHLKKAYPSIPLIRRFYASGPEFHIMTLQAKSGGKVDPAELPF